MTFPVIAATAQGNDTTNTTSHTVNLPASISAGDLLIVALAMDGNTTLTWPDAGWVALSGPTNSGGDGTLEVRYRIATGSEGSTITVTSGASEAGSHISYRITGWHGTTPPEAGTPATGNSNSPNPPSVVPSWGSDDNLFIAVAGWGVSSTNLSSYPTNYATSQMTDAASNANIAGIAVAARQLAAASDDPGVFTLASSDNWVAGTIVVRPAGAPAATLDQTAYRWRNDDGSESAATWKAAQNTDTSIALETPLRLRLQLDATGDPDGAQYRLDFRQKSPAVDLPESGDWGSPTSVLAPVTSTWEDILWGGSPGCVVKVGGTYYLYYVGADGVDESESPTNRAIGVATSSDGVTFSKYGSNPIVTYTTGGSEEEGATNPVVVHDGSTWHMWYAAGKDVGGGNVDLDIRYRTSTDGLTWTDDALVLTNSGDEFIPIGAFFYNSVWSVYYLGPLTGGAGALRRAYGADADTLGSTELVTATTFRGSSGLNLIGEHTMLIHLFAGSSTIISRTISRLTPGTISAQLDSYAITDSDRFAILLDRDEDTWLMYSLDLNVNNGEVVLRTATMTETGFEYTDWAAVAASATKIILAASANITASGEATTAQLTAPAGKTTADFDAGRIQDDENPADSVDITADDYTELEWCIEADTTAVAGYDYEFRLSIGGVAIDTYTQTPTLTIAAAGATINFTATLTAVSNTPAASLAVARSLAATITAASNAPDVVSLAVVRSLTATLTAATNTPDVVSLERLIALAATLTGATATPDNAALTVARSLAATLTAVSSTNDAASLAVLRQFVATLTAASATPDTVSLTVLLQLSAVMTAASATPDNANLVILRQLTATLTAVSSTPDASLEVLRQLAATLTAVTATPDDVTLSVAGFISFAATLTAATATNDTATLSVLRQMTATLTAVSDAPDVVILTVARQMAAVLTAVSDTPEDVSLVIARSLAATITAVSATPDTPSLAVLRQMIATLTAATDTPDEVNLNISGFIALAATITAATATNDAASLAVLRQLSATMTGATVTPEDVALGLIKHFLATLTAVSSTPDDASLIVQRSLAAALTAATNTPDNASLAVLRQLSAVATAQTATPDSVNLITALIQGLISIIFSSRQPGAAMTGRQPGATITARQPGANITGRPEGD